MSTFTEGHWWSTEGIASWVREMHRISCSKIVIVLCYFLCLLSDWKALVVFNYVQKQLKETCAE